MRRIRVWLWDWNEIADCQFPISDCRFATGNRRLRNIPIGNWQLKMKRRAKTYTISAVAEQFELHPQTLRLYEREGLLKPSRSEGNTRLYTDTDLERLEIILSLTRDLGVK